MSQLLTAWRRALSSLKPSKSAAKRKKEEEEEVVEEEEEEGEEAEGEESSKPRKGRGRRKKTAAKQIDSASIKSLIAKRKELNSFPIDKLSFSFTQVAACHR